MSEKNELLKRTANNENENETQQKVSMQQWI